MVIVDCHVHSLGNESIDDILRGMDSAGIDKAIVFSPYPASIPSESLIPKTSAGVTRHLEFSYLNVTSRKQKEVVEFIANLQREAPDRIIGLFGLNLGLGMLFKFWSGL